ncbi:hypothetical protein DL769_004732 [Monosporascus sp. CRB-8-3]|nr:hypothetical protein DL769_004732 [Monosporascus sp. CRB-8-3]
MDPLSITASVIAVVGAAQKCAQGIAMLREFQEAPEQLAALNNEVSDLELVLSHASSIGQQPSDDQHSSLLALSTQVERAGKQLHALRTLIEQHLVRHGKKGNTKVTRIGWIRERNRIAQMQRELRSTRLNISTALGVISSILQVEADTITHIYSDSEYLDSRRFTLLHKVVLGILKSPSLAELLTFHGRLNAVDASGRTCLSWAATRKDHHRMRLLLDAGANPSIPDFEGNPPLFHAIRASDLEGTQTLIAHGADLDRRDVFGGVVLHTACQARDFPDMVEFLVSAGLPVDVVDSDRNPPLHYAAWRDFPANVAKLLSLGASTTLTDFSGDRVMNVAINHGAERVVKLLLESSLSLGYVNKRKQTILHTAALSPRLTIIHLLAKADLSEVDPDMTDVDGKRFEDYFREKVEVGEVELWKAFRALVSNTAKQKISSEKEPLLMYQGGKSDKGSEDEFEDASETLDLHVL